MAVSKQEHFFGHNLQGITRAPSIQEANKLILSSQKPLTETLILVDLDLTIFDRLGIMSDLHASARKLFLDDLSKKDQKLIDLMYEKSPYVLIENGLPDILNQLINAGATVLGFTSRRSGKVTQDASITVEADACLNLKSLGIIFSEIKTQEFDIPAESVQLENPHLRPYAVVGKPMIFGQEYGVSTIFSANYPKGLILDHVIKYLASIGKRTDQVIVLDDNDKYLQNLKTACEANQMPFLGLHYTYARDHAQPLDEKTVALQKAKLLEDGTLVSEVEILSELAIESVSAAVPFKG